MLGSSPWRGRLRAAGCPQHPRPPPEMSQTWPCPLGAESPWRRMAFFVARLGSHSEARGHALRDPLSGRGADLTCPSHSEGQTRCRGPVGSAPSSLPGAGLAVPCAGPQRAQDPCCPFIVTPQVHTPGAGLVLGSGLGSRHTELLGRHRTPRVDSGPAALLHLAVAAQVTRASEPHSPSLGNGVATAPVSGSSRSGGGGHSPWGKRVTRCRWILSPRVGKRSPLPPQPEHCSPMRVCASPSRAAVWS